MSESKLIQEWLTYSRNDLISARHLFDDLYPRQIEISCAHLTPYGVVARYPNEITIDDVIAKAVIDKTQQVYDFCIEKMISDTDSY